MSNQAVDIEILGKLTRVNCPAGQEEALRKAANDLNSRVKEMRTRTKVTNEMHLLTIAALNVCYELQVKQAEASEKQALTEGMEQLSSTLDKVLKQVKTSSPLS